MEKDVITIPVTATYREAAEILCRHNISGAPVVDEAGHLVGMLSEKDLFIGLYPFEKSFYDNPEAYLDFEKRESKVEEIEYDSILPFIKTKVVTVGLDMPVLKAAGLMLAKGFHRLPVMEGDIMVGIITREHIFLNLIKMHLKF